MDACHQLASVADSIARDDPSPRRFVALLAEQVAGIRPGALGFADLLRGGRNRVSGRGFRSRMDDDTDGQARHFAGISAASLRVGPRLAKRMSRTIGGDSANSADGRLTDAAIAFTTAVLSGDQPVATAGEWIRDNLCAER